MYPKVLKVSVCMSFDMHLRDEHFGAVYFRLSSFYREILTKEVLTYITV